MRATETLRVHGLVLAVTVLAGCRDSVDDVSTPVPPPRVSMASLQPADCVDGIGEATLISLEDERYRETWELLEATSPLHAGSEPHGALLTTYVNDAALDAIEHADLSMPPGAVIALENYQADTTLSSISVMVRLGDPDPEYGGWCLARLGPAGEWEAGPRDACGSCHILDPDFVFGWELGTPLPVDSTGVVGEAPDPEQEEAREAE